MLMALVLMSCSENEMPSDVADDADYGRHLKHETIVLGKRLENPYKTENITKSLQELYPTKAGRIEVSTTDLYVRFLPEDGAQVEMLEEMGVHLTDHPLDYEIVEEGDWYHDPEVPDGQVTWQYAVVPYDFEFPDMEYEIIDECHISENVSGTRTDDGIDWEAVERNAYVLTGNADMLETDTRAEKVYPSGRITIIDPDADGGKPAGVKGVRVSCNSFVKFSHSYTDSEGYYKMGKKFSAKLRYRLIFENVKGFSIGVNLILVPASVSTLGKASPDGVNLTVTEDSEDKLFRRCVVNNSAYDYYERCTPDDLNLSLPPKDIRIWIFPRLKASSAVMLHHGALLDSDLLSSFLGDFAPLVKIFLPDITLGLQGDDFKGIYSTVCHELAHASHFSKVGTDYWNKYILYIIGSYISSGGMTYGDGKSTGSGYCEVGEMWAYYLSSKMYMERYAVSYPNFGTSYWFYPQIFRYLEEKGISAWELFSVMGTDVTSRDALLRALLARYPQKASYIQQIFNRYI